MDKKLEFNVNILDVSDVKEFLDFRKIREEDFPLIVKVLDIPTKFRKEVAIDYHNFYTLSGERSIVKIGRDLDDARKSLQSNENDERLKSRVSYLEAQKEILEKYNWQTALCTKLVC